jgi:hypothetical protein
MLVPLLSVVIFMKNAYLEKLLETSILYFFNTACYDVG